MPDKKTINIVQLYLRTLKDNNINIDKAILFGSYATGKEKDDSDIDLMLVSELFDTDFMKYLGKIWRLTSVSDYRIEPYVMGKKKFDEDDISPVILAAKQKGYEIPVH